MDTSAAMEVDSRVVNGQRFLDTSLPGWLLARTIQRERASDQRFICLDGACKTLLDVQLRSSSDTCLYESFYTGLQLFLQ